MLELMRKYDKRFHQVTTEDVYGSSPLVFTDHFYEKSCYDLRNPYFSTKAAANLLIRAYVKTYIIKATISSCSTNFWPNQHPEKLIPKTILIALLGKKIPIYGSGKQVRDRIYVKDHCIARNLIIHNGRIGETYVVSSENDINNLNVIINILKILGVTHNLIVNVRYRPGHNKRYSLSRMNIRKEIGWSPRYSFNDALRATVKHY